uniref:Transmembrane protein n=1 Tax=Salix viminalis TaxID=40686 RepID=A0A6N2M3E4_SALVM
MQPIKVDPTTDSVSLDYLLLISSSTPFLPPSVLSFCFKFFVIVSLGIFIFRFLFVESSVFLRVNQKQHLRWSFLALAIDSISKWKGSRVN